MVKRGWFANGSNFEWDLKFGSTTIWNLYKWLQFCWKHLKSRQKCLDFFRMVPRTIENWTIWIPIFKKSEFQMVRFQKTFLKNMSMIRIEGYSMLREGELESSKKQKWRWKNYFKTALKINWLVGPWRNRLS